MDEDIGNLASLISEVGLGDVTAPGADNTPIQQGFDRDHDMRAKIYELFSSELGAKVLDWLCSHTIRRSVIAFETIQTGMPSEDRMALAHFREGENEVVRRILIAMRDFKAIEEENSDAS